MSKYNQLEILTKKDSKNEIECGNFLVDVIPYLLLKTPKTIFSVSREDRSFFGSSDFIVSALFKGDAGQDEAAAYIWEIKAPQCFLMTPDDNGNRFRPTSDLSKAENQLIHYVYEANGNAMFRDRFKIGATGQVLAGGIIIGTDDTIVTKEEKSKSDKAYTSLKIRKELLYNSLNIRILTWNRIIEFLKEVEIK